MSATEVLEIAERSLRVGLMSTLWILVPGVALGCLLSRARFRGRSLLRAFVSLPMVLPPVAVGLVLLQLLSRRSLTGAWLQETFGGTLLLTWWGAVLASAVMSFPLLVLGAQQGFDAVPRRLEDVAATLGASPARIFWRVTLPLALPGVLYGAVFAFARGMGEFGATSLVAGHVPGRTETLSLGIQARIVDREDGQALVLCLVSLVIAFSITALAEVFLRGRRGAGR